MGKWSRKHGRDEYIDYLIGSGPMVLGHGHPEVLDAVKSQLGKGMTFFANNPHFGCNPAYEVLVVGNNDNSTFEIDHRLGECFLCAPTGQQSDY